MLEYYVKSPDPKTHIEVCSLINYFMCEILSDEILEKPSDFYAIFRIKSDEEVFEIFSEFSDAITLEMVKNKTLR